MTKSKKPNGRPTIFTETLAAKICQRIADGESIRAICSDPDMPSTTAIFRWIANGKYDGFRQLYEKGKLRIAAGTTADGQASVQWLDKDGKRRIDAGTFASGNASVQWRDKDGKQRIVATTFADGSANVLWRDQDEKMRIVAGTNADGTVKLPTQDDNPPKKP